MAEDESATAVEADGGESEGAAGSQIEAAVAEDAAGAEELEAQPYEVDPLWEEALQDEVGGDSDESYEEDEEIAEHLKDAVEGSIRLKRMLQEDVHEEDGEEAAPVPKRRRVAEPRCGEMEAKKVQHLLTKWGLQQEAVTKHVLEGLSLEELEGLIKTNYMPDKYNMWKGSAELLHTHTAQQRERLYFPGGGPLDCVSTFRARFKLEPEKHKLLLGLKHKELRHVLSTYDGGRRLEDVIEESKAVEAPPDDESLGAVPEGPGVKAVGRYHRLEIIDPTADSAVFGDANLTFAVALAKHRKGLGHVGRTIATTFEPLDTLRERYKEIDETIKVLEDHYADVYHSVDCTRIAVDHRFKGMEHSLGAVYYNFPHAGAVGGFFDGHPLVNWRHENLMRLFFRALRSFVKPGGVVKVSSNMGALGVRYSYIIGSALENEFIHVETIPFLEWHLHRYGRSYGDRRDSYKRPDAKNNESYNSQRAEADMVYMFEYKPTGGVLPKQQFRLPPTLLTLEACPDGPFQNLQGQSKKNLAKQLHHRFVKECSGIHVG